jgi:AraC-like DNA-binding protein
MGKGKEFYKVNNMTYAVNNENYLVLNEGCVYSSYINEPEEAESFSLNFTRQNINDILSACNRSAGDILDDPFFTFDSAVRFVEKLYANEGSINRYLHQLRLMTQPAGNGAVLELLYLILAEMTGIQKITDGEIENMAFRKRSTREELYKRLTMAKDYIHSCYNEDLSLHKIAQVSFLNDYYLLREFKKCFKVTPHQYLTRRRLTEATKLLVNTDRPLQAICNDIGFENVSSFCKLFKSQYHVPPAVFRNIAHT